MVINHSLLHVGEQWLLRWLDRNAQCSPQAKFKVCQGTTVGHALGGGCGHIKVFGISLFAHQRKFCTEGLLGRYALCMLGRTLYAQPRALPQQRGVNPYYQIQLHHSCETLPNGCLAASSLQRRLSTIATAFSRDLHDGKPNR